RKGSKCSGLCIFARWRAKKSCSRHAPSRKAREKFRISDNWDRSCAKFASLPLTKPAPHVSGSRSLKRATPQRRLLSQRLTPPIVLLTNARTDGAQERSANRLHAPAPLPRAFRKQIMIYSPYVPTTHLPKV